MFASNALALVYGSDYRTPFVTSSTQPRGADIARGTVQFSHVDSWKLGHDLVQLMYKVSDSTEPAAGGGAGASEFYGIFRSGFSINRIADSSVIHFGPLRDIDLQAGADLQAKNNAYAPAERTLLLGPRLLFHFYSGGFLNIGIHVRKEWNRNGFLGRNEDFSTGYNIEPAWGIPFRVGGLRFTLDGYADYNSSKGRDAQGHETRPELIVRPQLRFDLGAALGHAPGGLDVGLGLEYWHNMFGQDARFVPGADQNTVFFSVAYHWGSHRAPETDQRSELR